MASGSGSGSGSGRYALRVPHEDRKAWDLAAKRARRPLADWIKDRLALVAEAEMEGVDLARVLAEARKTRKGKP